MESNFLKERVVIREEIIRKNLEATKRESESKGKPGTSRDIDISAPNEKVLVLEELVNEKLKKSLAHIAKREDELSSVVADYLKIRSALKIFKINSKGVRVQTNIGCDFYAQCQIEDASKVYICIGKDYYLHMELDEAINMIDFKEKQIKKQLDHLQEEASRIKAYIKLSLEYIGRFQESVR